MGLVVVVVVRVRFGFRCRFRLGRSGCSGGSSFRGVGLVVL